MSNEAPPVRPTEDQLLDVANLVWGTMLHLEVSPAAPGTSDAGERVTGCVHLVGPEWKGAVLIGLSTHLAERATRLLLAFEDHESVESEDVQDAVGELTNMLAGNLNRILGVPCRLSPPLVTGGSNYVVALPNTEVLRRAELMCCGEPMSLTVLRHKAPSDTPRSHQQPRTGR